MIDMKNIIKQTGREKIIFSCDKCGCEYQSNEYVVEFGDTQYDVMNGKARREIINYIDICPACNHRNDRKPTTRSYKYYNA